MKRQGFTLIEVLIAMAILAGSVYVLCDVHIRSLYRLMYERDLLLNFFVAKKKLVEQMPLLEKKFKPQKSFVEERTLNVAVDLVEPDKKSILTNILGRKLALVKVVGSWQRGPFNEEVSAVGFVLREEELEANQK